MSLDEKLLQELDVSYNQLKECFRCNLGVQLNIDEPIYNLFIRTYDKYNKIKLASKEEILKKSVLSIPLKYKTVSGVYFLIFNNDIVYVGSSTDIYSRAMQHKDKTFNKVSFINYSDYYDYQLMELMYIKKFNPVYNKQNIFLKSIGHSIMTNCVKYIKENVDFNNHLKYDSDKYRFINCI